MHSHAKVRCRKHFAELLTSINAPMASNKAGCLCFANIIMMAFVCYHNDKVKFLGCLRRQEKLTS